MGDSRSRRIWELDPEYGHAPWRRAPDRVERVLHVHLGTPDEPQGSLCRALVSLAAPGGYRRVDWTALGTLRQRHQAVLDAASALRPTLIFMQLQRPGVLEPETVAQARRAAASPDLVVATWCGDVGGVNGPFPSSEGRWAFELSRYCDLMLYSSMSQVRAHRSRGMHNCGYLQIGYDEDRYFPGSEEGYGSRFDAVFLGRNYRHYPAGALPGQESDLRREVVEGLRGRMGRRFGLFGHGWGSGTSPVPAADSGELYRQAHLALSVSLCSFLERYSSDRLFRGLACGTPVLLKAFDDWRSFGLEQGENVLVWDSVGEAVALAQEWLDPARRQRLREVGRRGAQLAREHHCWGIRMQELYPYILAARGLEPEVTRPW